MAIKAQDRYDTDYVFATAFTSTADDVYEITEVGAVDVVLDRDANEFLSGEPMVFNFDISTADGEADETYTVQIIEGDAADFSGANNILAETMWTRGTTGLLQVDATPTRYRYLGVRTMGTGTTPSITYDSIWASPKR